MKLIVTIEQNLKYRQEIVAEFSNLEMAMPFISTALGVCRKSLVTIEVDEEKGEEE